MCRARSTSPTAARASSRSARATSGRRSTKSGDEIAAEQGTGDPTAVALGRDGRADPLPAAAAEDDAVHEPSERDPAGDLVRRPPQEQVAPGEPMKAIQIVDLSGPDSALREADVPEPEASHMLTPGSGVLVDVAAAGVSFPEVLQTRGEYQVKPPLPFVPGSEVAGIGAFGPRRLGPRAGAAGRGLPDARRLRRGCGRARVPDVPAPRRARRPPGRRADPQLPHGLVRAGAPRSSEGGGDRAGPRRRRRRRHRLDPGREGDRREGDRGRLDRREGAGRPRRRGRRGRPLRRLVARRGQGALRGRSRPRARPGRGRSLHRLAALPGRGRPARRRRLHRGLDPRGQASTACSSTTPRSSAPAGAPS